MLAALTGCRYVDEDMSDCEADTTVDYELKLVTNMTEELETQLGKADDAVVAEALETYLKYFFTDYAHDVDLSFYGALEDSIRLHHENHIMDAGKASYTLFIPVREYLHLAVANLEENGEVLFTQGEKCHTARLEQPVRDTVNGHTTGVFSARLPMDMKEGADQHFKANLYMANCASALVLDTLGSGIKDIRVYASGFATGFDLADSIYRYAYTPIVRTDRIPVGDTPDLPLCFAAVTFPSRDVPETKGSVAQNPLWHYRIYTLLKDNTTTETILGVKVPLQAGQLKVINAEIIEDGSCVPVAPYVGASVTLDWNQGASWEIEY